eukprot:COSAG02_NODE_22201_length_760_cov_0.987897_1_plen_200_part_00
MIQQPVKFRIRISFAEGLIVSIHRAAAAHTHARARGVTDRAGWPPAPPWRVSRMLSAPTPRAGPHSRRSRRSPPRSVPRDVALAAAPALVDVVAATEDRREYECAALLLARLVAEAAPDHAPVWGAAFAGERFAAYITSRLVTTALQRAVCDGDPPTPEDVHSLACMMSVIFPGQSRGLTAPNAAAGRTPAEYYKIVSR